MPDIDAATLEVLQRSHNVLMKLNGAAETRPLLEKAIKHHFPEVTTEEEASQRLVAPQIEAFTRDVATPLMDELKAMREQREAQAAAATEAQISDAFTDIRRTRHYTDEGVEAIKKLMVDNSIADPYAAAARFAELNPPASQEAPGWTPSSWNIDQSVTDYDLKGLFANEDSWADNMAQKALNEIRLGQAA